jgi:3-deoxy-D-manno-octulosonate 8-phosphate phosphatase (KDO 8-P phosphatase)
MLDDVYQRASAIKLMVFDVDGVLTDGSLYLSDSGEEIKAFNTLDGHGLKMLKASGVELAVITGRTSGSVAKRMQNLGIDLLYQGVENKLTTYLTLLKKLGLESHAAGFMGDDLPDLPPMRNCGLAVTVPEAPALMQSHAHYVTERAQRTLDAQIAPYLR